MPGTDPNSLFGRLGQILVLLTALGVIGHGILRLITRGKGGTHQ